MVARSRTVFVVIVNYNRWQDTVECLESVLRSDYPALRVIVVENASTDNSLERLSGWALGAESHATNGANPLSYLSSPPVRKPIEHLVASESTVADVLRERGGELPPVTIITARENRGFAAGNNIAFRTLLAVGSSGFVCLINNDMVVASNAISALVAEMQKNDSIGAVGGVILDYVVPDTAQMVGGGRMSRLGMSDAWGAGQPRTQLRLPESLDYITGGLLLTTLETLRTVGLLDEAFFLYAEDADWGERMRASGYRLRCTLDAVVWHKGSATTGAGSPFQDYHVVKSSLRFVRRHFAPLLPVAIPNTLIRCLVPKLVRGEWARARSVAKAHVDAFR